LNLVRLIDISDATKPRILGDMPTVQQPNSVAVNPRSGDVLVTGSDPDGSSGLQILPPGPFTARLNERRRSGRQNRKDTDLS
jgi:hypothetical protein